MQAPKGARGRQRGKVLEVASLRGGGATALYLATLDFNRDQDHGRWISLRTAQMYVQELVATTFLSELPEKTKEPIERLAMLLPSLLEEVARCAKEKVAPNGWRARLARRCQQAGGD